MSKFFKSMINMVRLVRLDQDDIPDVTKYLKNNKKFNEKAKHIHSKKENLKTSFWSSIDDLLKEEDNVKFIEDKSSNSRKK
jgi:hypothetical protein